MQTFPRPLKIRPNTTALAALALALLAGASHSAVLVNPALDYGAAEATGSSARLAFRATGSNLSFDGAEGASVTGHLAPASGNSNLIHDNWIDFALSFDADTALLSWQLGGSGLQNVTLQRTETAYFDSLRLDLHVATRLNTLSWDSLSFSGLALASAMPADGSVSNDTVTHWLVGSGADALSLHSWTLSGRALASGGNGEQVRLSIAPMALAPVSAVPEPGTAALLLAGLGITALLSRRRRS
jgi:hypothetical protein